MSINLRTELTKIANAIRSKKGTTSLIAPNEFADEILNLPSGDDPYDYFYEASSTNGASGTGAFLYLTKKYPTITMNCTSGSYLFQNARGLVDASNVSMRYSLASMSYAFYNCENMEKLPKIRWDYVTNFAQCFGYCSKLTFQELKNNNFTTAKATTLQGAFRGCTSFSGILDGDELGIKCDKCNSLNYTFTNDYNLTEIKNIGRTNLVTNYALCFNGLTNLETLCELEGDAVTNLSSAFSAKNLTNFKGFKNLGMVYTTTSTANYSYYTLDLSYSTLLTVDSLNSIIGNLYDIKTKGCKTQKLVLGTTNINKLTQSEIAVATNKGWTVS